MNRRSKIAALSACLLLTLPLLAREVLNVSPMAEAWLAREPAPAPADHEIDLEKATTIQREFIRLLQPTQGKIVGYKAALTSSAAQQRFGVEHPLRGVLLEKMLYSPGADLSLGLGTRLLFEGDLIVRVGDEVINEAKSREQTLAALDAAIPFLEIPDLPYAEGVPISGPNLTAINAGARAGVLGAPIPLEGDGWVERLAGLEVVLSMEDKEIARGRSSALLGHPLDAVLWLRDSLAKEGIRLKKGDLLSLGSITPLSPAKPGTVTARYLGLSEEPIEISVTFVTP